MHSFSEKLPRVDKNVTLLSQALNCDFSDRRTKNVLTDTMKVSMNLPIEIEIFDGF